MSARYYRRADQIEVQLIILLTPLSLDGVRRKIIEVTKVNNGDKGKPAKRLGRKAMDLRSISDYDSQVTDLIGVQV